MRIEPGFLRLVFSGGALLCGLALVPAGAEAQTVVVPAQQQPAAQPAASQQVVVQQPAQPAAQPAARETVGARRGTTTLRWSLVGPGIGLIIGGWISNAITGTIGALDIGLDDQERGHEASSLLGLSFVPIIGPFVNAGYWAGQEGKDGYVGAHLLWGILQTGGLVLCILGTIFQEPATTVATVALGEGDDAARLSVLPYADATGAGLNASIVGF